MKKQKRLVAFLLVISMIFIQISQATLIKVQAATQATYYVDPVNGNDSNNGTSINTPWLTITKAQTYIRSTKGNMTGDIYVYLRGGTYNLSSTINFTDLDSGTDGYYVRYVAYNNEKPVLSGGQQITGWTPVPGKNFYQASCNINTLAQLYVNGNRAQIAHSEVSYSGLAWYNNTSDTNSATDGIIVDPSVIGTNWRNKSDIQLVLDPKYQDWHEPHEMVSDVISSAAGNVILMKQPYFNWATTQLYSYNWNATDSFKIQNAYELLDQPGEWYLDRTAHILYYYPKTGENINTAVVIAPTLEKLINIKGSGLTSLATDISFQNITMMYGTWLDPTTNGFCGPQADIYYSGSGYTSPTWNEPLGNITVEDANYVDFIGCDIEHMGGTGILLLNADDNCQILGCKIEDISASGIQVGKENNNTNFGAGDRQCRYCLVKDNYVRFAPVEYNQCVSIYSPCAESLEVSHNEVYDSPYTAINVGLYLSVNIDTTCLNNKVDYNKVVRSMTTLNDGGAIYTHGYQGGTNEIKYNYIQEFAPKSGWGSAIYHDNASANYTTEDNVVENLNGSFWISAQNKPLQNITIANNYVTTDLSAVDTTQPGVTISNTIVENAPPSAWDSAAQAIINGSGLEPAYQYIRATDTYVLKSALNLTEAENYDAQSGTIVQPSTDGGQEVSGIDNGDWLQYNYTDFGSTKVNNFQARVSAVNSGGSIDIRLDATNGPIIGTLNIAPTGSLTTYTTQNCGISPTVGAHKIFLMFSGSSSGLMNLNSFQFSILSDPPRIFQLNTDPTNGSVTVTLNSDKSSTIQYSIDNGVTWSAYNGPLSIIKNCTLMAKSTNLAGNTSAISSLVISNIDKSLGDVNGDGKVNSADALMVLKSSAGKTVLSANQAKEADVTGDGKVNAADALEILKYASGSLTSFG